MTTNIENLCEHLGGSIENGPDRMALMSALFEGNPIYFKLEGGRKTPKLHVWRIQCHDSDRRYWTIEGQVSDKGLMSPSFTAQYWMRGDGGRMGYFKVS